MARKVRPIEGRAGGKLSPRRRPGSKGNTRAVKHGLATSDFRRWFRETRAAIEARLLAADAQADAIDPRRLGDELAADARRVVVLLDLLEARASESVGDDVALGELGDRLGRLIRVLARVRAVQVGLALRVAGLADGGPATIPDDAAGLKARLLAILEREAGQEAGRGNEA